MLGVARHRQSSHRRRTHPREVVTRHMTRVMSTATNPVGIEKQYKQTIRAFNKLIAAIFSANPAQ